MDNPLVQPDPGLFIWTIVTFLVLLTLLAKFAWKPLLQALENRQQMIRKSLEDAEHAKRELEQVQKNSELIISQARDEASSIITRSRIDATKLKEELSQKAHNEAEMIVKNAERQIQQETNRALSKVRQEAADISVMLASKLIRRNLTKEDNETLIKDAIKQLQPPQS